MTDSETEQQRGPSEAGRAPLDCAQMWENLCLADELSEDCLALEAGLEERSRMSPRDA